MLKQFLSKIVLTDFKNYSLRLLADSFAFQQSINKITIVCLCKKMFGLVTVVSLFAGFTNLRRYRNLKK